MALYHRLGPDGEILERVLTVDNGLGEDARLAESPLWTRVQPQLPGEPTPATDEPAPAAAPAAPAKKRAAARTEQPPDGDGDGGDG